MNILFTETFDRENERALSCSAGICRYGNSANPIVFENRFFGFILIPDELKVHSFEITNPNNTDSEKNIIREEKNDTKYKGKMEREEGGIKSQDYASYRSYEKKQGECAPYDKDPNFGNVFYNLADKLEKYRYEKSGIIKRPNDFHKGEYEGEKNKHPIPLNEAIVSNKEKGSKNGKNNAIFGIVININSDKKEEVVEDYYNKLRNVFEENKDLPIVIYDYNSDSEPLKFYKERERFEVLKELEKHYSDKDFKNKFQEATNFLSFQKINKYPILRSKEVDEVINRVEKKDIVEEFNNRQGEYKKNKEKNEVSNVFVLQDYKSYEK